MLQALILAAAGGAAVFSELFRENDNAAYHQTLAAVSGTEAAIPESQLNPLTTEAEHHAKTFVRYLAALSNGAPIYQPYVDSFAKFIHIQKGRDVDYSKLISAYSGSGSETSNVFLVRTVFDSYWQYPTTEIPNKPGLKPSIRISVTNSTNLKYYIVTLRAVLAGDNSIRPLRDNEVIDQRLSAEQMREIIESLLPATLGEHKATRSVRRLREGRYYGLSRIGDGASAILATITPSGEILQAYINPSALL
jgi:hypothetical protein